MKEKLTALFLSDWSLTEKALLLTDVLLLGVLIGWITSPLKKGIALFSNNTWDITHEHEENEEDEEE